MAAAYRDVSCSPLLLLSGDQVFIPALPALAVIFLLIKDGSQQEVGFNFLSKHHEDNVKSQYSTDFQIFSDFSTWTPAALHNNYLEKTKNSISSPLFIASGKNSGY